MRTLWVTVVKQNICIKHYTELNVYFQSVSKLCLHAAESSEDEQGSRAAPRPSGFVVWTSTHMVVDQRWEISVCAETVSQKVNKHEWK